MCHHDRVGHIETEVVTHAKEFLITFSPRKCIITSEKSRIIISLLFPAKTSVEIEYGPGLVKM